jgi:hypothetical protein
MRLSDEGAAREIVHDSADDRVGGDSFEQGRSAGYDQEAEDQDGRDDCDYLLDTFFASADACDMLGNRGAAVRAYAAALDDEVGVAFGAFDFGAQGHCRRIVAEKAGSYKCKVTRSNLTPNPFPYGKGNNRAYCNPVPLS